MSKADTEVVRDFLMGKKTFDSEVYEAIRSMYLSLAPKEKA